MGLTQRLGVLADVFQPDSSLNVGIGGAANSSYKLQVTGDANVTGSINAAGGNFSGTLNGTTGNFTTSVISPNITVSPIVSTAQSGGIRLGSQVAINARNAANSSDITLITTNSSDGVAIRNGALTIASTGAATFSSSVTADGGTSEGSIKIERDTVAANSVIGSLAFTNNNSATTYGKVFGGRNAAGDGYVALGTGISNNLYALETGNVGIGRSNPEFTLDVNGDIALNRQNKIMFASTTAGDRARSYFIGDYNNNLFFYGPYSNAIMTWAANSWVGIVNTTPAYYLEVGNAGTANPSNNYGGHAFNFIRISQGVWTTFATVTDQSWAGITELTWTSVADYNRSGAAHMRWAYTGGNIGVVYTLYNNSQNATATFRYTAGTLQINIAGGAADYYVQVRIQGSRAA